MKALVTGASGFVGSHLVEKLLAHGVEVACLVRSTSRLRWLESLPVERRLGDVTEPGGLDKAVEGVDFVFHAAALLRARTRQAYEAVNLDGTRNLLAAVRKGNAGLKRFVFISSLAAVGPCPTDQPLTERDEPHPINYYGLSKIEAEHAVLAEQGNFPVTVVRPPAVYGPRDETMLPLFVTAQRLHLAPIIGKPTKRLTLVHVADLVELSWLAATADAAAGQTYFVGSGDHSWAEVLDAIEAALHRKLLRVRVPAVIARLVGEVGELKWTLTGKPQVVSRRKMNDLLQTRWTCSWEKAKAELGYVPRVMLDEGMLETVRWYAENGWLRPLAATR